MIDIHNHILPSVDDGSSSMDETLDMILQAQEQGVTGIIVTPHHLHPKYNLDFKEVQKHLDELMAEDNIQNTNIQLFPGQEIRVTDEILKGIENGTIEGLNHSKYLLLEFPSGEVPNYTTRLFFEIQNLGYVPIIAHPERNKAIANNPNILFDLINEGALSQITSSSLAGNHGKKIKKLSMNFIEHNLVHFIASDAHNTNSRRFLMNDLHQDKSLRNLKKEINDLFDNADCIIKNEEILKNKPLQMKERNKFFGLF
ncbi:capsular biosynthesis protein [Staphylococcus simulans]|uniref:tyrosine-protein phosphatase n=1 Tax=Staphylococcus TaxID=1279 RepID=UPI000CCFFD5B|nr:MULTISPECIES: CpsB/CapC family capsule biosynthesis tyrosine phosphatase [Staphylococcus]MBO0387405.1 capsular biosynthesis protein [Staphylococcus simulans]MBU6942455.1 capsular biosynthesis protein [Staphylococcus sp. CWZ226]MDQ7115507.1 CpsB/CapC family capsule biosynthesis tyrosine phosphatase [Staphylococcus simulans]MDQ7140826.1 CpsB/CapC family capsule biosynthesis tyrosine phosphatase [Staphylococcus simulans]PNZ45380.1 capsular biosynthesis protein [Staphylococcus simulans]